MIKIIIFSDSYKHFYDGIKEYKKRLWKSINLLTLKPSKNKNINDIIKDETNLLKEKLIKDNWYKILLLIEWNNMSTIDFKKLVENNIMKYWNVTFIIWWAYGINFDEIKSKINFTLSLWKMTFPHSMSLLLLLEQIYRIKMIEKWSWYHH